MSVCTCMYVVDGVFVVMGTSGVLFDVQYLNPLYTSVHLSLWALHLYISPCGLCSFVCECAHPVWVCTQRQ